MRFDVITLFPELFDAFLKVGITRRAFDSGQVEVHFTNPRDFADGNYRRVDDRPFGGGPGMVLMAEPLLRALNHVRSERDNTSPAPVVLFSPIGRRLDQSAVQHWSQSTGAILLCGRYEGVDQRFIDAHVDLQISLGDFVVSGGELVAMAFLDALARLQPGVLTDQDSHVQDSFNAGLDGLLDSPHFTRPEEWAGCAVPDVLLSGHHSNIARWRRIQSLQITMLHRPDLIVQARANGLLDAIDEAVIAGQVRNCYN
jgi:tRNA (guanine37-N1)-methyltransferase